MARQPVPARVARVQRLRWSGAAGSHGRARVRSTDRRRAVRDASDE
jgi:hypothetical protein